MNLHHNLAFRFIWPLVDGDYPDPIKKLVTQKIPKFSRNRSRGLVGDVDFIGVNYYSTLGVKDNPINSTQDHNDFDVKRVHG